MYIDMHEQTIMHVMIADGRCWMVFIFWLGGIYANTLPNS